MATQKPVEWVAALITRFEDQLPCRTGPQTHHSRLNVQQNKECLIQISKFKFSLVISGLTKILQRINELRQTHTEFERDYYESLLIVMDTLERCLSSQAIEVAVAAKYDDSMNVKLLLREICQFLDPGRDQSQSGTYQDPSSNALQLRNLASKVLFALSLNNFGAVFSKISGRLQELSVTNEEAADHTDIELIQHINVDISRLTKLFTEAIAKFRSLKKNAHLILMQSLEKAVWNWMDTYPQVLVLTVLATLVKYTTDETEVRILYEYLAEASVVFPKVFPVIHSLLDAKITNVLSLCHDKTILAAVQCIIENMISCEDTSQQQLHFLQSCGFGGLWRFAGYFTKSNCNAENVELFVNCLEALVETCLPLDETDHELSQYPSMLSVSSNIKLSSSLTSISLSSPTDKCSINAPF